MKPRESGGNVSGVKPKRVQPKRRGPAAVPHPEVAVQAKPQPQPVQRGPRFGMAIGDVARQAFGGSQRERRKILREDEKKRTATKLRRAARVLDSAGRQARREYASPSSPELRNAYAAPRPQEKPDAAARDITRLREQASDRERSMSKRLAALRVLRTRHDVPLPNADYLRSVGAEMSPLEHEKARATVEGAVKAAVQAGPNVLPFRGSNFGAGEAATHARIQAAMSAPSVQRALHQLHQMPASPEALAGHRSWAQNFLKDVEDTVAGAPAGLVESVKTAGEGYRNLGLVATGHTPSAAQMHHGKTMGDALAKDDPIYGLVTGGWDEFKRRAHNHPLQAALDISGAGKLVGRGANVAIAGKLRGAQAAVRERAPLVVETGREAARVAVHREYPAHPLARGVVKGAEAVKRARGGNPDVATGARAERIAKRHAVRVGQREEAASLAREGRIRKVYRDVTKRQLRKGARAVDRTEERRAMLTLLHRGSVREGSEVEDLRAIESHLEGRAAGSAAASHNLAIVREIRRDAETRAGRALARDPRLRAASAELRGIGRAADADLTSYEYLAPAQAVKRRGIQGAVDRGDVSWREQGDRFTVEHPSSPEADVPRPSHSTVPTVEQEAPARFESVTHAPARSADELRAHASDLEHEARGWGIDVPRGRFDLAAVLKAQRGKLMSPERQGVLRDLHAAREQLAGTELAGAERALWQAHEQIRRAKASDAGSARPMSAEQMAASAARERELVASLEADGVTVPRGGFDVGEIVTKLEPTAKKTSIVERLQRVMRERDRREPHLRAARLPPDQRRAAGGRRRALPQKRVRQLEAQLRAARQAVKDAGGDAQLVRDAHARQLSPDELRAERAPKPDDVVEQTLTHDHELQAYESLKNHALAQGDHVRAQKFRDLAEARHEELAGSPVGVLEHPEAAQAAPRLSSERVAGESGFYDRHGNLVRAADVEGEDAAIVHTDFELGEAGRAARPRAREGFTGAQQLEQLLGDHAVLRTLGEQQRKIGIARLTHEWTNMGPTPKAVPLERAEAIAKAAREHNGMRYELIEGKGGYHVVPSVVMDVWRRQIKGPGRAATLSRWLSRNFVQAVLPFSVMWHAGNQADMLSRLAVSGVRLKDLGPAGPQVLHEFERVLADADPHVRDAALSWVKGHAGVRQQIDPVRFRDATAGLKGGLEQVGNAISGLRQVPGVKQLADAGSKVKDVSFNAAAGLEGRMTEAGAGIALRDMGKALGFEVEDQVALGRQLADAVTAKPELVEEFARRTVEIIGDYRKTPLARDFSAVLPFFNWMRAALTFTLKTLPSKHPLAAAAISEAVLLTEEQRLRRGESVFFSKDEIRELNKGRAYEDRYVLPSEGYLAGALNGQVPVTPFTSFGEVASLLSDPAKYAAEKPLPMLQAPLSALRGRAAPTGRDLVTQARGGPPVGSGKLYGVSRGEKFLSSLMESFVPGARQVHKARRKGAQPQVPSTIFHPKGVPGTETGVLNSLVNPAAQPGKGPVKEVVTDLPGDGKRKAAKKLTRVYDPTSGQWLKVP